MINHLNVDSVFAIEIYHCDFNGKKNGMKTYFVEIFIIFSMFNFIIYTFYQYTFAIKRYNFY